MNKNETFMIVVNPGTTTVGYSVYRNAELFKHGVIEAANSEDNNVILESLFDGILDLINSYPPSLLVYKTVPMSSSTKAYLLLQGMIMGICVTKQIFVKFISTAEWKKILGCKGNKSQNDKLAVKYVTKKYAEKTVAIEAEAICIGESILTQ